MMNGTAGQSKIDLVRCNMTNNIHNHESDVT